MHYLSKSRYMQGLSCPRALWVAVNEPSRIPPIDASTQAAFDIGHTVGDWAKKKYPSGVEIDRGSGATAVTKREMAKRVPLFEASFSHSHCYCKTDILVPVDEDEWDLIEVKASTSVKDEHLLDVAFQRFVVESCGVKIRRAHVLYVNNEYVRHGDIDVHSLFEMEDVTEATDLLIMDVPENVARLLAVLEGAEPRTALGVDCIDPKKCPVCLPSAEILSLYKIGAKAWPLLNDGITTFSSLPASFKLSEKQKIQKKAHVTGKAFVDKKQLSSWLRGLSYPLQILDFETFNSPVPMFDGVRPYQNIPFQFSLHIVSSDGTVDHYSCLANGDDPRHEVVTALRALKASGTVLAHNASFERGVLEGLAEMFPDESHRLHDAVSRLSDTIMPFREFWYYHPAQHGSCSLKAILPALTGKGYEGMTIGKGDVASSEYLRVTYTPVSAEERERVRTALLTYCKKDTESVIELLRILKEQT
jgi:hypothetical protein